MEAGLEFEDVDGVVGTRVELLTLLALLVLYVVLESVDVVIKGGARGREDAGVTVAQAPNSIVNFIVTKADLHTPFKLFLMHTFSILGAIQIIRNIFLANFTHTPPTPPPSPN